MKVLLYTEFSNIIGNSGLGKAIKHQMKALDEVGISYTTNPKDDYDIIHINFYGPRSYFLAKKAHRKGKKVVYHAHSTEEDFRNSFVGSNLFAPLFKKWISKCYSLGDHIITPTPYTKKILKGYGITKPITAISNGIELHFFEKNEAAGEAFRNLYGFKKNDVVIIGIGLYIERKGILDFVELAKRMPSYKFIWFGYSPLYASPKKVRQAVKTKLPNLQFPGYVDPAVIKGALSGANLYLFPTLEETEGIPAIEALAAKQKLLVRDIPVFEDWLEDGIHCYKAKDMDAFEEKINAIIKGELPDTTTQGYQVAQKRSMKNVGKSLHRVYKKVMSEKN